MPKPLSISTPFLIWSRKIEKEKRCPWWRGGGERDRDGIERRRKEREKVVERGAQERQIRDKREPKY